LIMATILQCLLMRPSESARYLSVRWVVKKKAIAGNKIVALGFDEVTEREWLIEEVYQLEREEQGLSHNGKPCQCYFHVVK